jgi:putative tryptophan/tyrosine transport system substrate-binding protein
VSHGGSLRWRSNITVEYRTYAQHIDKLSEWAAELSKARVDAITTVGDLAIRAAQEATKPFLSLRSQTIWFRIGLVNSMARHKRQHNGVSILATELDDIESRTAQRSRRPSPWRRHPALQRLNVLASLMLYANRQLIIDRVAAVRLPAIYQWPETAEEGGFVGYGSRLVDLWRNVLPRRLAQLAFSRKAVSYRSRPRVRCQPPISMVVP